MVIKDIRLYLTLLYQFNKYNKNYHRLHDFLTDIIFITRHVFSRSLILRQPLDCSYVNQRYCKILTTNEISSTELKKLKQSSLTSELVCKRCCQSCVTKHACHSRVLASTGSGSISSSYDYSWKIYY